MTDERPNILFIMSDDHAAHAMSCYGSRINTTPNLDRIANEGMRLDACLCTNSICAPSRASILTGAYSHVNGVLTLNDRFDGRRLTVQKLLQQAGYQTAITGKWHLGHGDIHDPTGFDYWNVLPGQGLYHNPEMIELGEHKVYPGYATDIITDLSLDWLRRRDPQRPFCLMVHHKAPHRPWDPDERHAHLYDEIDIPEPVTFDDDYQHRARAASAARMRIDRDLNDRDTKGPPPAGLSPAELKHWKYQRYIKDYLRCVASIDDNTGRLLDYLDQEELTENTVVIYTSDQGFFLGDHGWYDKRFFYEESLQMPFVVRYPREIKPATSDDRLVINVDFAPTFLDYAGLPVAPEMQGRSFRAILRGESPPGWREAMYYRYFMHLAHHNVYAHYGLRTPRYKLIYYYEHEPDPPEWELFDLAKDPHELRNVYDQPDYQETLHRLKDQLRQLREELGDSTNPWDA
ncbi:MAG: sulfatase [Chloroflexi bacterium]|nr:sulfatase [Chloroflexota bacterium]